MIGRPVARGGVAVLGAVVGGGLFIIGALVLLPSGGEIAAAKLRAIGSTARVMVAATPVVAAVAKPQTPEMLARRFAQKEPLSASELRDLLAYSVTSADSGTLSAMADRLGAAMPNSTAQISWAILASGRPAVASAFLELRPDRGQPALWRLRFELHRKADDLGFAQAMVSKAATRPGAAPPRDLMEAAYAVNMTEAIVIAAERGAIARLDRARSLDLVRRAAIAGRNDLIRRIDLAGTADWRLDDPWLAINLARRSGDTAAALRFAGLLGSGSAAVRRSIIMASGNRPAIRAILLADAQTAKDPLAIAQQLLETGFRPDAIMVLRGDCSGRAVDDALCQRMLYLMGPRPDGESLAWLRARAGDNDQWRDIYVQRERPSAALSFVESLPSGGRTDMLLARLALAAAARNHEASIRALNSVLDGRPLTRADLKSIAAYAPPRLDRRQTLALVRARIAAGAASPTDNMDLAWDAWNHGKPQQAFESLQAQLEMRPDDLAAQRLMADVEAKLRGEKAARPWLERVLAASPTQSRERAEILERLGRKREAITLVEALRHESPGDTRLLLIQARLLVATGDPVRARKMLQP